MENEIKSQPGSAPDANPGEQSVAGGTQGSDNDPGNANDKTETSPAPHQTDPSRDEEVVDETETGAGLEPVSDYYGTPLSAAAGKAMADYDPDELAVQPAELVEFRPPLDLLAYGRF